jgi:hypothetical protein
VLTLVLFGDKIELRLVKSPPDVYVFRGVANERFWFSSPSGRVVVVTGQRVKAVSLAACREGGLSKFAETMTRESSEADPVK